MRQLRARSIATGAFVGLVAIALGIACAWVRPSMRPFAPGDVLRPYEGLLVLHVHTERALRSISISKVVVPLDVKGGGTRLSLIAVPAGWHRWTGVGLPANANDVDEPRTVQLWFPAAPELRFTVEPGAINYAGMLEVYDHGWYVSIRPVDRAAFSLEELRSRLATAIAPYPIRYSGSARHVFLERYFAAQAAHRAAPEPARGDPR